MAILRTVDSEIKIKNVYNCSECNINETCVPSESVNSGYICIFGNFYYEKENYSYLGDINE